MKHLLEAKILLDAEIFSICNCEKLDTPSGNRWQNYRELAAREACDNVPYLYSRETESAARNEIREIAESCLLSWLFDDENGKQQKIPSRT